MDNAPKPPRDYARFTFIAACAGAMVAGGIRSWERDTLAAWELQKVEAAKVLAVKAAWSQAVEAGAQLTVDVLLALSEDGIVRADPEKLGEPLKQVFRRVIKRQNFQTPWPTNYKEPLLFLRPHVLTLSTPPAPDSAPAP